MSNIWHYVIEWTGQLDNYYDNIVQSCVFGCLDMFPWWRHQMETFSALLAICAGNSPVPGEFPTQRPVTRSFDVFFDLCLNKRLSKQSWGWWFETLSHPLWRHSNALCGCSMVCGLLKRQGQRLPLAILYGVFAWQPVAEGQYFLWHQQQPCIIEQFSHRHELDLRVYPI